MSTTKGKSKAKSKAKKKPTAKSKPIVKAKPKPKGNTVSKMIGNQFWKLRSKHGRDKLFSSPKILWDEACKYFEWCDKNPLAEVQQARRSAPIKTNGKESKSSMDNDNGLIELPLMRSYTWEGLELFLDIDSLREYKTNDSYKDFSQVITRIGKIIYTQKFTGAAAGLLNPNIIARDLGLSDKQELTGKDGESLIPTLSDEELIDKIHRISKLTK